ncbi:MAG: P-loop NTPase, partial [Methanobrevibacter sp.]|nr:P-loop NTPase [Methanobrevibacter sp.]
MANNGHGHHGAANLTPEQQKQMIEQELRLFEHMKNIKYKIAVMSGKGGVGKSTVAANLAEAFQKKGLLTGILDADIHGPNIPKMLGVEGKDVMIEHGEMIPVMSNNGIKVMSMGFLIESNDTPIIWRGPQKSGSIKQFMADTAWGDLDVLIIDNPPGTG